MNNQVPMVCGGCKLKESKSVRSRREKELEYHKDIFDVEDALKITLTDGTLTEHNLITADVRLGNKCNLQCVMCFPGSSNQWIKDWASVTGTDSFDVSGKTYNITEQNPEFNFPEQDQIYDILNQESLRRIIFHGGEPMLINKHFDLLRTFIENDSASIIDLAYHINLTYLPEFAWDIWNQFKTVTLMASIDGVQEVNDVIRHPSKWNVIYDNLLFLDQTPDNYIIKMNSTVSIMNLEHLLIFQQWFKDQNFKKIKTHHFNAVTLPLYMNPELLDSDQLEQMKSLLNYNTNPVTKNIIDSNRFKFTDPDVKQHNRECLKRVFKNPEVFPLLAKFISEW